MKCEYCDRPWSWSAQCQGCGAWQSHHPTFMPAIMYDSNVFSEDQVKYLVTPNTNIPIVATDRKISDSFYSRTLATERL